MKIENYDIPGGKTFSDLFPGPGRPPKSSGKQRRTKAEQGLPNFKIGDIIKVLEKDSDTAAPTPSAFRGKEGKIIAIHPEIKAADVTLKGMTMTGTLWLTGLQKLN
jgi:hypothetical protein|tara:strand:+ start:31 stop:348 length:318 start_codon:yes stop_codon:yes gene_type:complete